MDAVFRLQGGQGKRLEEVADMVLEAEATLAASPR